MSADGSQTYWALKKTVEQGLRADPNTLELLFVQSVRPLDELGQWLLDVRGALLAWDPAPTPPSGAGSE